MKILAIESSCDETASAVIEDGTTILSQSIATSSSMHEVWGGIVPEVAAREQLKSIIPVIMETLSIFKPYDKTKPETFPYRNVIEENIDAIAVTVGPGLIGSLLIGVEVAKTIAYVTKIPIIPVNHVLAHMYANFISHPASPARFAESRRAGRQSSAISNKPQNNTLAESRKLKAESLIPIAFPAISLVVSGGHTELFLMTSPKELKWLGGTIDDAAGEAFDKTARLLGFGSRGGVAIQESAQLYANLINNHQSSINPAISGVNNQQSTNLQIKLPRPLLHDKTLNFSFSGLKTAILREVNTVKTNQQFNNETIAQLSFEVQEAITDVLVAKTLHAVEIHAAKSILISGGVAANLRLREKFQSTIGNIQFHSPPVSLCTDNAVYIGAYAFFKGTPVDWRTIEAIPNASVEIS
jgi:N6-L-threonylcarbamoyladenine synthase